MPHYRALTLARSVLPLVGGSIREGRVHSVFSQAANVLLPSQRLLALTTPAATRVPNAIVIPHSSVREDRLLGLSPGMDVRVGSGMVWVPDARISIETTGVPDWDPHPAFPRPPIDPAHVVRNLERLQEYLAGWGGVGSELFDLVEGLGRGAKRDQADHVPSQPFRERSAEALSELCRLMQHRRLVGLGSAARALVGLGPGLTPSGDDVLIGLCAALHLAAAMGEPALEEYCTRATAVIVDAARDGTSMLSRTWLESAARGEFSRELGDLLVALMAPGSWVVDESASKVLGIGASSGFDSVLGLLFGTRSLEAVGREQLREAS